MRRRSAGARPTAVSRRSPIRSTRWTTTAHGSPASSIRRRHAPARSRPPIAMWRSASIGQSKPSAACWRPRTERLRPPGRGSNRIGGRGEGRAMSQVSVTINGRQFRMACEDGQEGHLMELARDLDSRIEGLRSKFGEIGDTRLTVMAALTIADVLSENAQRIKRLEDEVAVLADARATAADQAKTVQSAVAAALTAAAERIEIITKKLNQTSAGNGVALG